MRIGPLWLFPLLLAVPSIDVTAQEPDSSAAPAPRRARPTATVPT